MFYSVLFIKQFTPYSTPPATPSAKRKADDPIDTRTPKRPALDITSIANLNLHRRQTYKLFVTDKSELIDWKRADGQGGVRFTVWFYDTTVSIFIYLSIIQ
jgi:hypothetical protein